MAVIAQDLLLIILNAAAVAVLGYIGAKVRGFSGEWEERGEKLEKHDRVVIGDDETGRSGLIDVAGAHDERLSDVEERVDRLWRRQEVHFERAGEDDLFFRDGGGGAVEDTGVADGSD